MLRVLSLAGLALVAALPCASAAREILWSSDRLLVWEDFEGRVRDAGHASRVAAASTSIGWSYTYDVAWSSAGCRFKLASIDSRAAFSTSDSWVKAGHRTPTVLAHEQGHFDIAEIYRRRFEAETRDIVGTTGSCEGRRRNRVASFVEAEIRDRVGPIFERVWRDYTESQERYDAETRHGLDKAAQTEWGGRIEAGLKDFERWPAG